MPPTRSRLVLPQTSCSNATAHAILHKTCHWYIDSIQSALRQWPMVWCWPGSRSCMPPVGGSGQQHDPSIQIHGNPVGGALTQFLQSVHTTHQCIYWWHKPHQCTAMPPELLRLTHISPTKAWPVAQPITGQQQSPQPQQMCMVMLHLEIRS